MADMHKIEYVRKIPADGKERDKGGHIVRSWSVDECSYKTGDTSDMRKHKARKHAIGEYMWKIPDDGKERDKWANIIQVCGVMGARTRRGIRRT